MSDFLFSSDPSAIALLAKRLEMLGDSCGGRRTHAFSGQWGSLAVREGPYAGFAPIETSEHIAVVVGGPVLTFRSNDFLVATPSNRGTGAILERALAGLMQWQADVSGPFAFIVVNKRDGELTVVTDMMLWVPVYVHSARSPLLLGTHVDTLAGVTAPAPHLDEIGIADFILNGAVTWPYTVHSGITQLHPAATYKGRLAGKPGLGDPVLYWSPREQNAFREIGDAARAVGAALERYVGAVAGGMTHVAHFLSGGEDSRVVAGVLPRHLRRDAIVILDQLNREGRIARTAASAYGAGFLPLFRSPTHYLDILPPASLLVGSGHQYIHAHTLGLDASTVLDRYQAVFGGFSSDVLLKAFYAPRRGGTRRWPFVPEIFRPEGPAAFPKSSSAFKPAVLDSVSERRAIHRRQVMEFREKSAAEWSVIWPATIRPGIPNVFANRRLFRSYEPFLANSIVDISAGVPTEWKLNRRLFHKSVREYLAPSWWLRQASGRWPYFPWWANLPLFAGYTLGTKIGKRMGLVRGNQGPWGDWQAMMKSDAWEQTFQAHASAFARIAHLFEANSLIALMSGNDLSRSMKVDLVQTLFLLDTGAAGGGEVRSR
jgi:hypothetical protein